MAAIPGVEDPQGVGLRMESVASITEAPARFSLTLGELLGLDGVSEGAAVVVLKRSNGVLLGVPVDFVEEEVLQVGNLGIEDGVFGASTVVTVPGVIVEDGQMSPIGADLNVLLVDCREDILQCMKQVEGGEDVLVPFSEDDPEAFPMPAEIVAAALAWLREESGMASAALYLSSPEVTAESGEEARGVLGASAKASAIPRHPGGPMPTGKPKQKQKKPTAASLATSMETMSATLQVLLDRQQVLEKRIQENPTTMAMQRPLTSQMTEGSSEVATLAKTMQPPPRTLGGRLGALALQSTAPKEVQELEAEKERIDPSNLAQAISAQSAALTSLVAHLAANSQDAMGDLMSGTTTPGSRGAAGRAKLQLPKVPQVEEVGEIKMEAEDVEMQRAEAEARRSSSSSKRRRLS